MKILIKHVNEYDKVAIFITESIVKGFRADDENEAKEAMAKADKLIEKVQKAKQKVINNDDDDEDLPMTKTGNKVFGLLVRRLNEILSIFSSVFFCVEGHR